MVEESTYKLKKLIVELGSIRGRHTELVTVYIPAGYSVSDIINQLKSEQGTAANIKSKATRKNVMGALEKAIQHLRLYKKTPENGLAVFSGNVSEKEGVSDIKVWAIEPPEALRTKLYWCDQVFRLEPLQDMVREKEIYGLIVLDTNEAAIGLLKGKRIIVLRHMTSIVPGKTAKGGQCLSGNTLVPLADGNIVRMENLKGRLAVKALHKRKFSVEDSIIKDFWKTGKKKYYKIVTWFPRAEIEVSKDHVFLVLKGGTIIEKATDELKEGDFLLMPEKLDVKGTRQNLSTNYFFSYMLTDEGRNIIKKKREEAGLSQTKLASKLGLWQGTISGIERGARTFKEHGIQDLKKICQLIDIEFDDFYKICVVSADRVKLPVTLTQDLAQIVGYFIGDGNFDKNRVTFSEGDRQLAEFYRNKFVDVFNCSIGFRYRKTKNYYETRIYSKAVENFIRGEFFENKESLKVLIPEKILKSDNDVLAAFLRGFWDAEGYVSSRLALGINNKLLTQQIQIALLRFGIIASLQEYDSRRNPYSDNHRWTIEIGERESLMLFEKFIGFSSERKVKRLRRLISKRFDKSHVRRVAFSGKEVRKILEAYGMKKQQFPKVMGFFYDKQLMSKVAFKRSILDNVTDDELRKKLERIVGIPLIPVVVKEIKEYEKEVKMFDISVGWENFVANGIFVHNSAARFERVRKGLLGDWFKQVAEQAREVLPKELLGIVVGGPGPIKGQWMDGEYLQTELRKKVIAVQDTGYSDEHGLHELVERAKDALAKASVAKEKMLVQKFLEHLKKNTGLVAYGLQSVLQALEVGAVETILVSEEAPFVQLELEDSKDHGEKRFVRKEEADKTQKCKICGGKMGVMGERDIIEAFEDIAKQTAANIEVISKDTREGEQLLALGGIGAILRYRLR